MATAAPSLPSIHPGQGELHCPQCGHVLRTVGGGRHRLVFEPDGAAGAGDVILNRGCPQCGRGLPGKGTLWVAPAE